MFEITPLEAPFGAEVRGWEPGRRLSEGEAEILRSSLREHVLLLLRGHPPPSDEEFARLGENFGELFAGGELYGLESKSRDVLRVSNALDSEGYEEGYAGSGYLPWHSDYSFRARAAKETLLEAVILPTNGPRTHFVNTYLAYDDLDAELRERIQGLVGRHDPLASARHVPARSGENAQEYGERMHPNADLPYKGDAPPHPLVHPHPESGRIALYVSTFVGRIDTLPDDEASALVDTLLSHAIRPERTYSHEWQQGDLIVFDDIGIIHSRDDFDRDTTRSMRQMSTQMPG